MNIRSTRPKAAPQKKSWLHRRPENKSYGATPAENIRDVVSIASVPVAAVTLGALAGGRLGGGLLSGLAAAGACVFGGALGGSIAAPLIQQDAGKLLGCDQDIFWEDQDGLMIAGGLIGGVTAGLGSLAGSFGVKPGIPLALTALALTGGFFAAGAFAAKINE